MNEHPRGKPRGTKPDFSNKKDRLTLVELGILTKDPIIVTALCESTVLYIIWYSWKRKIKLMHPDFLKQKVIGGAKMVSMLKEMKKTKNGIPQKKLDVFEGIIQKYAREAGPNLTGVKCFEPEWDDEFCKAMNKHLTREQRFQLYETHGACNGTGADKSRKAFALEHARLALDERIELFSETFKRWKPVLNDDKTLTLHFKCTHGYYKRAIEGKYTAPPPNVELYFERCAGGRLYELQKALGIKLKIKSVDVSPLKDNVKNPVVFTFEIVESTTHTKQTLK
jgi:hypothetical protein